MDDLWTLPELVDACEDSIAALPAPKNGQVRAVPDERTIRYYATLGLLDRPLAMRGRTALYGPRHLAQVIAIKRLQTMGRSLAEIQEMWPTLDDVTLTRMSGVNVVGAPASPAVARREEFWKRQPVEQPLEAPATEPALPTAAQLTISIEIAPHISLTIPVSAGVALSQADVRAIRAAAAPLVTELARRQLTPHARDSSGRGGTV